MRGRAAALVGCLLAASACTSPTTRNSSASGDAVAISFALAAEPRWRFESGKDGAEPNDVRLDGGYLILTGLVNMPFTVIDLATGKTAWELDEFQGRLGAGVNTRRLQRAISGDGIVPVEFMASCFDDEETAACPGTGAGLDEAVGVAGLDLATGTPRWFRRLAGGIAEGQPGRYDSLSMQVDVVGVSSATVVATCRIRAGRTRGDGKAGAITYGLNARTGAIRWQRSGFLATEALGERVLGVNVDAKRGPADDLVLKGPSRWTGIDLSTGKPVWENDVGPSLVVGRADDVVLLQRRDTGQVVALETRSGTAHDVGQPLAHIECPRQIVPTALACSHSQRDTANFILDFADPGAPTRSAVPIPDGGVSAQAGDVVFVSEMPYRGLNNQRKPSYAARLDGTRVSELWPGTTVTASDKWVVLGWRAASGARLDAYAVQSR